MRYFLELSYNGSNYCGWQRQANAPSVQQTLEEALSKYLRENVEVTGAGRTDTGVHAAYYVAHFDTVAELADTTGGKDISDPFESDKTSMEVGVADDADSKVSDGCIKNDRNGNGNGKRSRSKDFLYHLNSMLPGDIALHGITQVADDAHARFDATEREYTYYILPYKDPFHRDASWQYTVPLDVDAMNRAAAWLTKYDDFTSFAKLDSGNKTNICHVTTAEWRCVRERMFPFPGARAALLQGTHDGGNGKDNVNGFDGSNHGFGCPAGKPTRPSDCIRFTIRADRFLRNMVRAIVGTLVDVGRGKISPERFREIIEARDLSLSSGGAPAQGLFLTDIKYSNLKLNKHD